MDIDLVNEKNRNLGTLARVRSSCCLLEASQVKVDHGKVAEFVATYDKNTIAEKGSSLASQGPTSFTGLIEFESDRNEAGFIALTHALDFSSGFRVQLHSFHSLGAWNTVKEGVVRLYKENPSLKADYYRAVTVEKAMELFLPGLDQCKEEHVKEPLHQLCRMFCSCLNEIGEGLANLGHETMTDFVFSVLEESDRPASALVQAQVDAFPQCFNDVHTYSNGQQVYLYKKAQLVVGELYHRFRQTIPLFNFVDASELTCFCDNVIVATMRKTGCIQVSEDLNRAIDSGVLLPSGGPEEVALRAKALEAVELIAKATDVLPAEVGNFLWGVLGKEPAFRAFPRHATQDTVFY